jgi:predicted CXXCH cytochrome family protein
MRFDVALRRCLPLCLTGLVGMAGSHVFAQNTENAAPAKYVGVEVCQGCHEDLYESFSKSAHVETLKNKSAGTSGCEGCHGPGAEHVESGGDPGKIWRYAGAKPDTVLERCKRCHEANLGEAHTKAHLSCLTCHSVHHYQEKRFLLIKSAAQLCRSCHHH